MLSQKEREQIIALVHQQVVPAIGCTEPICVALAVARSREVLECVPAKIEARLSANIIKNAMGVGIPGTGMVGLPIAIALGALYGRSCLELEVLRDCPAGAVEEGKSYIQRGAIHITLAEDAPDKLYVDITGTAPDGTTARVVISGHHTHFARIERNGEVLLDNADCTAEIRGCRLRLGGLSSAADPTWLERFRQKPGCKILLCHQPEFYDRFSLQGFDLILSGHVHGGQWRWKNHGIFAPDQGFLPRYHHGVYHGHMVVSAGCSNTSLLPRFGNPCEVVLVRLVPQFSTSGR